MLYGNIVTRLFTKMLSFCERNLHKRVKSLISCAELKRKIGGESCMGDEKKLRGKRDSTYAPVLFPLLVFLRLLMICVKCSMNKVKGKRPGLLNSGSWKPFPTHWIDERSLTSTPWVWKINVLVLQQYDYYFLIILSSQPLSHAIIILTYMQIANYTHTLAHTHTHTYIYQLLINNQ